MLNGLYILDSDAFDLVYGESERTAIAEHVRMLSGPQTAVSIRANPHLLEEVDVIFSGWGMARADERFLAAAPKLKAIFYAAGAVGSWLTNAVAARGIKVTSAHVANSVPVAEYTLAMILLSLKHTFQLANQTRAARLYPDRNGSPGAYGATVGLISYGVIARLLRAHLGHFELNVLVHDPFVSASEAARQGVELVDLDELFARSDVVSLHTPLLPETVGLISGEHLSSMKFGATFINTARGPVVREEEMLIVLARRPDLQAILDVTAIEPPPANSAMYTLPNVLLTPHIAGSAGGECRRMGHEMVQELERFVRDEPLKLQVDFSKLSHTSNRPLRSPIESKVATNI
ncbi:MAG: D-isomer specific 2-hydroxyacid dehydrogenase NAD-binding [Phycisphaerales bacterium]|nr:D-isomer specific 2-hydroxyacid dehydrogenase NAD-binding [Phycisphaerales bacterium]